MCVCLCVGIAALIPWSGLAAAGLPHELDNDDFCRMAKDFSEPGGIFPFELVSNEMGYQKAIPSLGTRPGGVYLGVGPEQNFTYIAAVHPAIAFIVDIRRDNLVEHLVYKELFEMSANRADFVSRLFSRQTPRNRSDSLTASDLFHAFDSTKPDAELLRSTQQAVKDRLEQRMTHCLPTEADKRTVDRLLEAFSDLGPGFFKRGSTATVMGRPVSSYYADLMAATDNAGRSWSFMASEENYNFVRDMEQRNLIVPVVGDLSGPKTIRAIARYIKEQSAVVSTFYISNVEDYLFAPADPDAWKRFYGNVAELPIGSGSGFIRTRGARQVTRIDGIPHFDSSLPPGTQFVTLTGSVQRLIEAFEGGRIQTQDDVLRLSLN